MFKLINLRFPQLNSKLQKFQVKPFAPLYVLIFGLLTSTIVMGITSLWYRANPTVAYTTDNLVGEIAEPDQVVFYSPNQAAEPKVTAPTLDPVSQVAAEQGQEHAAGVQTTAEPVAAKKPTAKELALTKMQHPIQGQISPGYEFAYSPIYEDYRLHPGFDYAAQEGSKVVAALEGVVGSIVPSAEGGSLVTLKHGSGWETSYTALETNLKESQHVDQGALLGRLVGTVSGETDRGTHLHFELRKDGRAMDPGEYLR